MDRNAHPCYTVYALSDLAVSGGEPFEASLPGTVFSKHTQRDHVSLLPGDSAYERSVLKCGLLREPDAFVSLNEIRREQPGAYFRSVAQDGIVPSSDEVACGSSGPSAFSP
jgi:hypothetical protein